MDWSSILYLVAVLVINVIFSIISVLISRKVTKKKQSTEKVESVESGGVVKEDNTSSGFWSEVFQKIPQYIVDAEKFFNQITNGALGVKTGAQKLDRVLEKIKIDCLTSGEQYNEEKATKMVNDLVDLTNQVNTNKK